MLHFRYILPLFFFSLCLTAVAQSAEPAKPAAPAVNIPEAPVYSSIQFQPLLRARQDPSRFEDPGKAAELFKAREELIQALLKERQKILATDNEARKLHAEILKLNKKLAAVMESKHAVREISREMTIIDAKIDNLELKKAPTKKVEPAKKAEPAKNSPQNNVKK